MLIVAGSRGKTGAAHLAAMGALRSGAGLVTVATPASCQPIVAAMAPEYMTEPLAETPTDGVDAGRRRARARAAARDVIAIGPGLGTAPARRGVRARRWSSARACRWCSTPTRSTRSPTIPDRLVGREGRDVIITPHPGEMARLVGMSTDEVQANRLEVARDFAVDASASTSC